MLQINFRVVRKAICIIGMLIVMVTSYKSLLCNVELDGSLKPLSTISDTFYDPLTSNSGYTSINGFSNIYNKLIFNGWNLYDITITNSFIDASFVKDGDSSYRVYYKFPDGYIVFLSSNYEDSDRLNSYIIKEGK